MNNLLIWSRQQVLEMPPPLEDSVLISIRDASEDPLPKAVTSRYLAALPLVFDDTLACFSGDAMTTEQGSDLWRFFTKWQDRPCIVHCHAGVSRSPAVGIAWAIHHRNPKVLLEIVSNDRFSPNPTVVRKYLEAAENIEKRRVWSGWQVVEQGI